jgi:hypothetical protein
MALVALKEQQAERIAHLLDDVLRVPGTRMRIGADPLIGLAPIIGDTIATVWGASILVIARQLDVPWSAIAYMAYNLLKNGLIGAIPFVGDAYSLYFKSNALNAAFLLRTVKRGEEGACPLTTRPLSIRDIVGLAALILPTVVLVAVVSLWFWERNVSYLSLFFPAPYQSR